MEHDYENPWIYRGIPFISCNIEDYFGFVYCITNITNDKRYIGRKNLFCYRKVKGKRRRIKQESDWKNYYGSCEELKEDVKTFGKENFKREILSLHKTQGKLNFEETRQLFYHNVLTESLENGEPAFYNSQILNRYFKKDYFKNLD